MPTRTSSPAVETETIPPIVLLVEDDRDTREMYSAFFEMSGMWVATTTAPAEAIDAVAELKPDIVVTDVGLSGEPPGLDLVQTLKSRADTCHIPVIVLSGRAIDDLSADAHHADICLEKPVLPDLLLDHVRSLVDRARLTRQGGEALRETAQRVTAKASELLAAVKTVTAPGDDRVRTCPECAGKLDWIERGRIGGSEYDYYRWCPQGCGLFCYDRAARSWVKLA